MNSGELGMGQLDSGLRSRPLRSQQRSNDAYGVARCISRNDCGIDEQPVLGYDGSKSKRLEDRLMPEKQEETIRELTLMLMYLTSWEERDTPEMRAVKKKELEKYPLVRRCWKGYDHDLLDKLSEEGLINAAGRTYPALITPEGEAEARKLLAQYGIDTEGRRRRSAER
mgnify:CR=1 FL=1